MTEFGLNKQIMSEVSDEMYLIGRLLSQACRETAEISNDFRWRSGLYEIGVTLGRIASRLDDLRVYANNMGIALDEGIKSYIACENRIYKKYSEKK